MTDHLQGKMSVNFGTPWNRRQLVPKPSGRQSATGSQPEKVAQKAVVPTLGVEPSFDHNAHVKK
jgi:hypothetical protein